MIQNIEKFKGIFVAFYACFDEKGEISEKKAARLAAWYAEKGINGLYLNGSSGEGMLLSVEERNRMVDAVMETVGGKLTVICHVGANSTKDALALARHAKRAGCDAVSSVPNIYYPLPERCIEDYWDALIDAAQLPFIIYNIPSTTGYNISLDLFEKMIQKEYVAGIKTTSPSCALINSFKRIGGERTVIFNGEDAQLLAGLTMGATGGIGGTYGAMPELYVKLYAAYKCGNMAEALKWQERAAVALNYGRVGWTPGIASMKAILNARGQDVGPVRAPFRTVSSHENVIQETVAMIDNWLREA